MTRGESVGYPTLLARESQVFLIRPDRWRGRSLISLPDECRHVQIILLDRALHRLLHRLQAWPLPGGCGHGDARGCGYRVPITCRTDGDGRRMLRLVGRNRPGG